MSSYSHSKYEICRIPNALPFRHALSVTERRREEKPKRSVVSNSKGTKIKKAPELLARTLLFMNPNNATVHF